MTNQLGKKEDVADGLIRQVRDELSGAIVDLGGTAPREARVHQIRQRLKRSRTLLRVLERAFGDRAASVRRDLAATARLLAGARDADVMAASARELAAANARDGDDIGFERVAEALDREAAASHKQRARSGEIRRRLATAMAAMCAFNTDFDGQKLVDASIERAYRRGRRAMRRSQSSLATPDLHQWRKEVKRLWHLVRMARRRLPDGARRLARRLNRLGDLLGLDHDHAMLAERLALSPTGDPALMRQLAAIAQRRRSLEAKAFKIGAKLYRKEPKKFRRRIRVS